MDAGVTPTALPRHVWIAAAAYAYRQVFWVLESPMEEPRPQIFLRPIGSPLTVGMSGLAIASFVASGLSLNWIAKSQALYVGVVLASVPFVLQLTACVFSFLARDGATAAAVGVLSTTWLAIGLVHIVARTASVNGALGLLLIMSGVTLALSSLAVGTAKPLPALVFLLAAARFGADAAYELSSGSFWEHLAGIIGLVVTGVSAYCVLAFELEGQRHRPVLPTFRRGRGRDALAGPVDTRIDGVTDEAGVRQTT
jgi:succinate-acetate transporter protein